MIDIENVLANRERNRDKGFHFSDSTGLYALCGAVMPQPQPRTTTGPLCRGCIEWMAEYRERCSSC